MNYFAKPIPLKRGLLVEIYHNHYTLEKIGEYFRNYDSLFNTFYPFVLDGKNYALYSKCYTATRVMSLPDCKDLGGEESHSFGFCPVDYYVPQGCNFGFVAGCVWGDDSSWKLQYLDLSNVEFGIIKRDDRFGYLELPNMPLDQAVECDSECSYLTISKIKRFKLNGEKE